MVQHLTFCLTRKEEAVAWGRSQEVHLDTAAAGVFIPSKDYLSDLLSRYAVEVTPKKKSVTRGKSPLHDEFSLS